ncbi:hypothetical protein N431DRAFT_436204 [Stipitochalara longipes BDJ]|nr:hypothetical protein N431DRAFT_436204 [Stipitochalara longipes BDJ]
MEQPPQLAGLFAGGMPKLKKRGGGVDTGGEKLGFQCSRVYLITYSQPRIVLYFRPGIDYKFCP